MSPLSISLLNLLIVEPTFKLNSKIEIISTDKNRTPKNRLIEI